MASKSDICNLAISHCGVSTEIGNVDTDDSEEASSCRRFFNIARDTTFRDHRWPFTVEFRTLALVEEDPTDEWKFSYRYPADTVRLVRILSGIRNDNRQTRISYRLGKDDQGVLIYTDMKDACMERTVIVTDTGLFPIDFVMAMSYRLAWYIAPRLTAGDPFQLRNTLSAAYFQELSQARRSALNEEQPDEEPNSEFIRVREAFSDLSDRDEFQAYPSGFKVL